MLIVLVSVIANIFAHATWQYYGIDGGHMISRHANRFAGGVGPPWIQHY